MVTARRIAEKYEKMLRANPTWKMESLQQTVQEEMLADVLYRRVLQKYI
jgi:alpha-galactosidase